MRLTKVVLSGYKRFASRTILDTDDQLVALVGPNEAGKSSVLGALKHLDHDAPWSPRERFLGAAADHSLKATFTLDSHDRAFLSSNDGRFVPLRHLVVTKTPDGSRHFDTAPDLGQDLSARDRALALLEEVRDDPAFDYQWNAVRSIGHEDLSEVETLLLDSQRTSDVDQQAISSVADRLSAAEYQGIERPETGEDAPPSNIDGIRELGRALNNVVEVDRLPSLNKRAAEVLHTRIPRIVEFTAEDRDLLHEYPLDDLPSMSSGALANLAHVAGFQLSDLHQAASEGDGAHLEEIQDSARTALDELFASDRWRQADLQVRLSVLVNSLQLTVRNRGSDRFMYLNERSAGLQWFVSLSTFIERHAGSREVILLIDEAEQHLHYDGQADLIAILSDPTIASQVIYTTHSAGCLPPDLGRGVRAIVPSSSEGIPTSTIETGFWDDGPGFSGLLLGMGASVLALTAPGCLLLAEGTTEAILLPTLLRVANGVGSLGYQVAPGISQTSPSDYRSLDRHAGRTAYVVDGDEDGARYARRLKDAGVPDERVFNLGEMTGVVDLNVEELVDPEVYVTTVNTLLSEHNQGAPQLTTGDLPTAKWSKFVDGWCRVEGVSAPSKRVVAQRIVDLTRGADGATTSELLNPEYRAHLADMHSRLRQVFELQE